MSDNESVEKEIQELILNFKSKRLSITEPCCRDNLDKSLKSVQEELSNVSIKFLFDPYAGEEKGETLVRLVNASWSLVLLHKDVSVNGERLNERNNALEQNNFFLNNMVDKLNQDFVLNDSKLKQVEEVKRQMILKADSSQREAAKVTEELKRFKKQLAAHDTQTSTEKKRMERDYAQLQDKFRGQCGMYMSKNEAKNTYVEGYRIREKKYKEIIAKLQENNRQLLHEVIDLKEDLLAQEYGDDR